MLVREGFSDAFIFSVLVGEPRKTGLHHIKAGQTKEVMVNGRLFKIDVEEAHCKSYSSFLLFSFFSFSTGNGVFSSLHGMGYGVRVSKRHCSFCFVFSTLGRISFCLFVGDTFTQLNDS